MNINYTIAIYDILYDNEHSKLRILQNYKKLKILAHRAEPKAAVKPSMDIERSATGRPPPP